MSTPPDPAITRLPGIGAQLEVHDVDGQPVRVIRLADGSLELHTPEGSSVVVLDASAAQSFGAFAAGHISLPPRVLDRVEHVLGGLAFDWVTLPEGAYAAGRSIEELEVRRRTGVSVVAILRGLLPIVDPEPSARLEPGDDLVVACREQDIEAFERYLVDGP